MAKKDQEQLIETYASKLKNRWIAAGDNRRRFCGNGGRAGGQRVMGDGAMRTIRRDISSYFVPFVAASTGSPR
jgi:hypothetical protein